MNKIHPRDILALALIVGCLILKFFGMDGTVSAVLVGIVAFYFGLNTKTPRDDENGKSTTTRPTSGIY